MKLSDRVRPGSEAAPWVIEEIKRLEAAMEVKAAPVCEREAYEAWKLTMKPYGFDGFDAYQAGAAYQRQSVTEAARDVLAERQRQISAEGWTPDHDDEHGGGQLADAAACYALSASGMPFELWQAFWPWDGAWLKAGEGRRSLVKAGALILAEIERLDRLNGAGSHE